VVAGEEQHDELGGIAAADAWLGRPFPLPSAPLPLVRWTAIAPAGARGAELAWNLDDSRPGMPARLALYAGTEPPPARELPGGSAARELRHGDLVLEHRSAPLEAAQESLRPVQELAWTVGGVHLRLTAQGPWELDALLAVAASVVV